MWQACCWRCGGPSTGQRPRAPELLPRPAAREQDGLHVGCCLEPVLCWFGLRRAVLKRQTLLAQVCRDFDEGLDLSPQPVSARPAFLPAAVLILDLQYLGDLLGDGRSEPLPAVFGSGQ